VRFFLYQVRYPGSSQSVRAEPSPFGLNLSKPIGLLLFRIYFALSPPGTLHDRQVGANLL
jgi:hypothetical protein